MKSTGRLWVDSCGFLVGDYGSARLSQQATRALKTTNTGHGRRMVGQYLSEEEARNDQEGLLAICTECGTPQGAFAYEGELRRRMAQQGKCKNEGCNARFSFLSDGRIWNLRWEIIPNKEDYAIKLLEQVVEQEQQVIFCYEDYGPQALRYRYPEKRMTFHLLEKTGRASPAYAMNISILLMPLSEMFIA